MPEAFFKTGDELLYVRHNDPGPERRTLLFIHGLGDSGLSFEDVFDDARFDGFNLVVPDLVGYGRSSGCPRQNGYGFESHIARLWDLIRAWNLPPLTVIGHSMGGDLSTLLCRSDTGGVIEGFVNIEGVLTQFDLFISGRAVKADREGRFDPWFRKFVDKTVYEDYGRLRSGRLYHASLCFCRPRAFIENAIEIVARNSSLSGHYQSEIGRIYCSLGIHRVFCHGTDSLRKETLQFIEENNLKVRAFERTGHCPMTDRTEEFYEFLSRFVSGPVGQNPCGSDS